MLRCSSLTELASILPDGGIVRGFARSARTGPTARGACIGAPGASPSPQGRPRGGLRGVRGKGGSAVAQYEGYCMKCRTKRTFEGQVVTLKNGRPAAQGKCPVC